MTSLIWIVSSLLFLCGLAAVILRRQLLAMLFGLEVMIVAVNAGLVYYANLFADPAGLSAVLLIIAVAAAEAVVGLSLILRLYKTGRPPESSAITELRG